MFAFVDRVRTSGIALLAAFLALPAVAAARRPYRPEPPERAVAVACASVAPGEAVPLRRALVESVAPLYQNTRSGRHLSGATLIVRAEPGLGAEQVQRIFECQIARCAVRPASESCPLAVTGVRARVTTAEGRFRVQLWSDYVGAGREIFDRSRALGS